MSQPDLIHLPLSQLGISKLNMRHGRKAPDVSDILASIREKGTAMASSPDAAGSLRSNRSRRRPAAIRWCLAP